MNYPDIRLPAIGPGFSGSVQYKNSVHLSITIRRGPKPQMYRSCLLLQERSPDVNFFCGPAKQLNARDQEIPSRQCGQFLGTKCIHDRSDTGPVYLACAHGTRFTTRIEYAAADLLSQKMFNCHCHQIGFRVGGWIAIRIYVFCAFKTILSSKTRSAPKGWLPVALAWKDNSIASLKKSSWISTGVLTGLILQLSS